MQTTWNLNPERGGVELRFTEKPPALTRIALKSRGWRWSPAGGCWYHKDSPDTRDQAREIAGGGDASATPAAQPAGSATRRTKTKRGPRQTGSYLVRTSGGEFYQNHNGRCEDAPCCGCCS
jgi:hypothetical protein